MNKCFFYLLIVILTMSLSSYGKKWTGSILKEFDSSELWVELTTKLKEAKMNYGVVASSARILEYFGDLKSKEFAYQNIVEMIDFGYPFNLRSVFMSGDLELTGKENFSQSYNLYKASIDLEKNMIKWSNSYFARVDKENFPKFLFYQALNEFNNMKLDDSLISLDKALAGVQDPSYLSLTKKISRTMARIYYEQKKYKEAFDIYQNYLLKLNPIDPNDWIEGAWSLYRLGRYDEALGYLYNLEIADPDQQNLNLEKFIIRGLIYREKCATSNTQFLYKSFEGEFGVTIEKIKLGESLKSLPILKRVIDRNSDYRRVLKTLDELQAERKKATQLPTKLRPIAEFFYSTEIKNQERNRDAFEDIALNEAARRLVIMGESLRFLQFEVVREKFNPDKVFSPTLPPQDKLVEDSRENQFLLHWLQWGDYWLDERTLYRGILKSRCE